MSDETFRILLIVDIYIYFISIELKEKNFIMLLHNNTIATATFLSTTESPSSTTPPSVYSLSNPTNQYYPAPWLEQRLLTDPFFVRILFSLN